MKVNGNQAVLRHTPAYFFVDIQQPSLIAPFDGQEKKRIVSTGII